jgi:hypothetical protein
LIDDGAPLRFQVVDQCPSILPIDEGTRPRDRGQPFANLLGDLPRALRTGKLKPQAPFGGGIAGADFVRIPTIVTTRSDGSRPPVPIDRDQCDGAVRCIC